MNLIQMYLFWSCPLIGTELNSSSAVFYGSARNQLTAQGSNSSKGAGLTQTGEPGNPSAAQTGLTAASSPAVAAGPWWTARETGALDGEVVKAEPW